MSRRFGRNQRRRAREAIAQLGNEIESLQQARMLDAGLMRRQGDKLQALQQEIDDAKEILGPYCIAFKPKELKVEGEARRHVVMTASDQDLHAPSVGITPDSYDYRRVLLPVMAAHVSRSDVRYQLHALVTFGDSAPAAYAVDERNAMLMSDRRLYEILVENLSLQMLHALKKTK